MSRRLVVTGSGTVNPLGLTVESWNRLVEGNSDVAQLRCSTHPKRRPVRYRSQKLKCYLVAR
jgi:hypothetical protein